MNSSSTGDFTLITGASSGIGRALAFEFAKHNHHLVLVAPSIVELQDVASQIRAGSSVTVHCVASDLTSPSAPEQILHELDAKGVRLSHLVNNAGLGHRGKFWEVGLEKHLESIRLNIDAVVRLTHAVLPRLIQAGHGRILNTASIAGFEPGPLMAVYHATKAFVLSWSEAIATELEGTGVNVCALCPGPTDTDFFPKADMLTTNAFQRGNLMDPVEVAAAGYKGLHDNERVVVPGGMNKAMVFGRRLVSESASASKNEKFYEDAPADKQKRQRGDVETDPAKSLQEANSGSRR